MVQNLTVRLHIIREQDGVRIIFMPFAILKSADFSSLKDMAEALYLGTGYMESLNRFEKECEERGKDFSEESFIALYRAVVYSISYYIGQEVCKYIDMVYDKEVVFFEQYNKSRELF